ncbi:MAG: ComF family protein [Syntrophobacteraceae bacterium]
MRRILSRIPEGLKLIGSMLADLCFPKSCAGCGKIDNRSEGFWCAACVEEIPRIASPICPRCGRPFLDAPDSPDHLCGECLKSAFHFDSARSAVLHAGIVRDRIHQFKFHGRLEWVRPLAELLEITHSGREIAPLDMVLPVPLHINRIKERGFNQSGLLARELARKLGLPVFYDLLIRQKWTEPQTRLNRRERLKNVKGAFAAPDAEKIRDRRILLIDDVFTTGETLSECARTLKKKGASEVHALTVTRASPD